MVFSERVEGSTLARAITIIPEGQGGFGRARGGGGQGGQGGFGGGQAGAAGGGVRPLFGTIESIVDSGFTLETQQGPLPIAMNDETIIIETGQGTLADLEAGMQVRVTGAADEDGTISARNVIVTPEGLEGIPASAVVASLVVVVAETVVVREAATSTFHADPLRRRT